MKKKLLIIVILTGVLFVTAASAQIQYANDFWISTNATGNIYPSGGTLDNPLDGSTEANFDSNMRSLPPNSTVHILAGTYQTLGGDAWQLESGQKALGSGMDVTVLRLTSSALDDDFVLGNSGYDVTNVEISDLTCDCNYTSGSVTYHGVTVEGPANAVRRVKVIHAAHFGSNSEAWGIALGPYASTDPRGSLIENCEVSHFLGGPISALTISGGSGIMCNNRVILPTANTSELAFNDSFAHNVLIEGNYVEGSDFACYSDTGGNTNFIITHNTFKNCRIGIFYYNNGNVRQNFTISYNTIMLTTNTPYGSGNGKYAISLGSACTNFNIIGNNVMWDGEPAPGELGYTYFINVSAPQSLLVANNRVDPRMQNNLPGNSGANYIAYDNYDFSGNFLTNLDQRIISTNQAFFILPPDAYVQMFGSGSVNLGQVQSLSGNGFCAWVCTSNANASLFKALPLPNDYWSGKQTFVTSWKIRTTNSGNYVFTIANVYVLTNDISGIVQKTISFSAPTGTNTTTIAATNSIPTADIANLQSVLYLANQIQPGNYSILSGKVTAQ